MIKATVVIPNWNGKRFLQICLPSIKKQTFCDFETIIVDNGSNDDSVTFVKDKYPECRLICIPENKGFSKAVNEGIKVARGEYIVLLNNDTELDENFLEQLCHALDENKEVGFCASKMLSYDDHTIIDGVGDHYLKGGRAIKLGSAEKDTGQYDEPSYVFGACAGAAIYRKQFFKKIGLFDEDFFAYLEDVDISFRAQLAGFKCLYVPSAKVYHIGSATTGSRVNKTTVFLSAKNYVNVIIKNLPAKLLWQNAVWIVITILYDFLKYVYYGKGFSLAYIYIKGLITGLKQIPVMKKKRKIIQSNIEVSIDYIREIMLNQKRK